MPGRAPGDTKGGTCVMKLKRMGLMTKILLIVLIVYAITALIGLRSSIEKSRAEAAALQQQVIDKEAQNAELRYYIENSDDDAVKEDIARHHNYVKQGEKVYRTTD